MTREGLASRTRVMLVDDHPDFRDLMVTLLEGQPDLEVVAQAGSMAEARAGVGTSGFAVVILDLGLPDGNGADLIGELRTASPGEAVLIMSASLHPTNIGKAMRAGPRLSDTLHTNMDNGRSIKHRGPERTRPGADGRKRSVRVGKTGMTTGGTNTPARTG